MHGKEGWGKVRSSNSDVDYSCRLQRREEDVEEPEDDENGAADVLGDGRTAELCAHEEAAQHQDGDSDDGGDGVEDDAKAERTRRHVEVRALCHGEKR